MKLTRAYLKAVEIRDIVNEMKKQDCEVNAEVVGQAMAAQMLTEGDPFEDCATVEDIYDKVCEEGFIVEDVCENWYLVEECYKREKSIGNVVNNLLALVEQSVDLKELTNGKDNINSNGARKGSSK